MCSCRHVRNDRFVFSIGDADSNGLKNHSLVRNRFNSNAPLVEFSTLMPCHEKEKEKKWEGEKWFWIYETNLRLNRKRCAQSGFENHLNSEMGHGKSCALTQLKRHESTWSNIAIEWARWAKYGTPFLRRSSYFTYLMYAAASGRFYGLDGRGFRIVTK